MVNMKLEKKQENMNETMLGSPEYPDGLRIVLDNESLKKLDIKKPPDMKLSYMLHCKAEIASFMQKTDNEGEKATMCLQITDMEIAAAEEKVSTSQTLYGGGLKGNINYVEGF